MSVRLISDEYLDGTVKYVKFAGLSTDTKPTGSYATGSEFFEVDTGTTYYYDEDGDAGSEWVDPTASGS